MKVALFLLILTAFVHLDFGFLLHEQQRWSSKKRCPTFLIFNGNQITIPSLYRRTCNQGIGWKDRSSIGFIDVAFLRRLRSCDKHYLRMAKTSSSSSSSTTSTTTKVDNNETKLVRRNSRKPRINSHVRNIMNLLMSRYNDDTTTNTISSSRSKSRFGRNNTSGSNDNNSKKSTTTQISYSSSYNTSEWTKTRNYLYRTKKEDLIEGQVLEVINFLDTVVAPNNSTLVKFILQTSPRILRKNVQSYLLPTTEFLYDLWGPTLFQEAISRNPDLLLSSGLGYNDSPKDTNRNSNVISSSSSSNNNIKDDDDDDNDNDDSRQTNDGMKTDDNNFEKNLTLISNNENSNERIEDMLKMELQMKPSAIAKLKKSSPFIFAVSPMKLRSIVEYLESILIQGGSNSDGFVISRNLIPTIIGKVIISNPNLVNLSVENNLQPRVEYLMKRCRWNETDMARLLKSGKSSGLLGLSVEDNLRPTIDYLLTLVNGDETILRKCTLTHPQMLALSLKNLCTKVAYFNAIEKLSSSGNESISTTRQVNDQVKNEIKMITTKTLEFTPSLACRIIIRSPAVYSLSLNKNIIPTVEFLAKVWGTDAPIVTWKNNIAHSEDAQMIIKVPRKRNKKSSKKDKNNDNMMKPSTTSLAGLLKEYPSILTLSLDGNIKPTLNFYNRTGYTSLTNDWKLRPGKGTVTLIRGRYIAASLYQRLLPRLHYCLTHGVQQQQVEPEMDGSDEEEKTSSTSMSSSSSNNNDNIQTTVVPPSPPPLHLLVSASDQIFCDHFQFDISDFMEFKKESIPRLKFSSQFDTWLKTGRRIDV